MIIETPQGYPRQWSKYCNIVRSNTIQLSEIGFVSKRGNINRFGSRFRAANSFNKICFDSYCDATAKGYSSLFHVTLTWSAFEAFMEIRGIKQQNLEQLFDNKETNKVMGEIREIDKQTLFYKFIYERVNKTHKIELTKYFDQKPCNITYLVSSIRHIFAHGWLSPNANNVNPNKVCKICNLLCQFLILFMDQEFSQSIDKVCI